MSDVYEHDELAASVANVLLHDKQADNTEIIMFPYTSYFNVMAKPEVIDDIADNNGAPFMLYSDDDVELSSAEINKLCGKII